MRHFKFFFIVLVLFSCKSEKPEQQLMLWYNEPAEIWAEALPVGNGRLGAMIYGGIEKEHIQFNEETLWTGQPHDYAHNGAWHYLDTLRQLLWSGRQAEAHKLGNEQFMSQPFGQLCYQPFGDIYLEFPGHERALNYRRELCLGEGVSRVSYDVDGMHYTREVFASEPGQVLVIHLESGGKGKLNFTASLKTLHSSSSVSVAQNTITLSGRANNYPRELDRRGNPYPESLLTFESRLKILPRGGEMELTDSTITVKNAGSATLMLAGATGFVNYKDISGNPSARCEDYLTAVEGKSYKSLKNEHIKNFKSYFDRLDIDLGESEISKRPTNERLNTFYQDQDPNLVALLYQYGRYLLISSSRPGTQPANLQGIWNELLSPPWDSKYTTNINTEMNYWPAEIGNLSDCADPLFRMIEDLSVTGQNVAREHYNMGGWVFHHNADLWRGAAPINDANHGIWVTGGPWLCQHLWWHYQFTGDTSFLRNRAYPVMKEAARFFTEYLVPDPVHPEWLISGPSNSPEIGGLVMGPTMDHQIIRNLFASTIEAAQILGVDEDFAALVKEKRARIAPNQIGQHGQLQEWLEDRDDPANQHRHVSHLWGLHPGDEIHPTTTPELAEACKVTLAHRGDGGTGWSRAWKINFWARLLDGDHSFLLLRNLMVPAGNNPVDYTNKGGLYPNLFDAHPPFQIDGNFGATSGITEMLLQSHLRDENGNYYLDILPALPSAMPSGKIEGVCARGGFELSITWTDGKLNEVTVLSKSGNPCKMRYMGKVVPMETQKGKTYRIDKDLNVL